MKTRARSVLLLSITCWGSLACEGEPPKTPPGIPSAVDTAPRPAERARDAATVADGSPTSATEHDCPCMDRQMSMMDRARNTDAGIADAAAAVDKAPDPVTETPAIAPHGDIVGMVKTTPPAAAANAVVYLEDGPTTEPTHGPAPHVDNHQMVFIPFVQVVTAGGKVVFTNSDPFPHNVFSPDNDKFNLGTIAQNGGAASHRFDKAGRYTILCNLHPGMIGYVVVVPSAFFAKTNAKGHFTIKDIPAGTYQITAWAPREKVVTQSVTVTEGEVTSDFELHR
jgi:plastocyanin